ncbi:hypothetical protein GCM10017781_27650 [Deinococcus metalli]|uniref:Uncharacterized protein n=1 Tax=Deinococcus metalli TaxID=1141878 RepID=A0ABQ3JPH1_9DEIO|nr:hypothetical protein GCM10017781_27650 [Deinococcus metalli]
MRRGRKLAEQEVLAQAHQTLNLIVERKGASLSRLRHELLRLRAVVRRLPTRIRWLDDVEPQPADDTLRGTIGPQWPELGFYDGDTHHPDITESTESVGDAIDDLVDIAGDIQKALLLRASTGAITSITSSGT